MKKFINISALMSFFLFGAMFTACSDNEPSPPNPDVDDNSEFVIPNGIKKHIPNKKEFEEIIAGQLWKEVKVEENDRAEITFDGKLIPTQDCRGELNKREETLFGLTGEGDIYVLMDEVWDLQDPSNRYWLKSMELGIPEPESYNYNPQNGVLSHPKTGKIQIVDFSENELVCIKRVTSEIKDKNRTGTFLLRYKNVQKNFTLDKDPLPAISKVEFNEIDYQPLRVPNITPMTSEEFNR
ncbi:MAG: hypothetical protein NC343_08820, partial [Muribaculum sp.]|nr:hypothetical protein [Muribaculum sp.]